ncbi:50S ribosomal protein L2 [Candidatus Woesearchaeota archaeon]|nr:50S ribosomal protein L2 [Candidatus Woesearchaeota archaeon]
MGKRIISQRRGRGTSRYRSPSHRFKSEVSLIPMHSAPLKGKIVDFIHCPGHCAPIAKIVYEDGQVSHIPAPEGVRVSEEVSSKEAAGYGSVAELRDIAEGTDVYNIEAQPGDGGKFVRGSGVSAKVIAKYNNRVIVLMPSKKKKEFNPGCRACIGIVAAGGRLEKPIVKAGNAHHKNKARNKLYPKTSGNSMNAVDHPYGTSRTSKKGRPTVARKHAPPGAKVGKIKARRTGRRKGKK